MSAYNDGYSLCLPGPHSPDCHASPMSELAHCFTGLSAFQTGDTPRRCLDLSNISSGSPDAGATQQSPQQDKPIALPMNSDSPVPSFRNSRMKKLRSFLPRLLCSSPKFVSSEAPCSSKENVPPRHRLGSTSGVLPSLESQLQGNAESCALGSPIFLLPLSPTHHPPGEGDTDGFMDSLEQESEEGAAGASLSCSMAQLLSEPLMNEEVDLSSVSVSVQGGRRLFRSPSMPERLQRLAGKRGSTSPVAANRPFKRHCTFAVISEEARQGSQEPEDARQRRHLLKKTHSLCEVSQTLGDALNVELIGDFSKMHALPTVTGRHQDLKYITGGTMCALLEGRFSSLVESFVLVDCRYPYEFQGGHIKGALNLPNTVEAVDFLLTQRLRARAPEKRLVLVLHCEFSSERAPRTSRLLRSEDRSVNEYPALHYPEIYILQGGYRDFFHSHQEHCDPRSYCPMHHQDHREELLRCRTDSRASVDEHRRRQLLLRLGKH